MSDVSVVFHLFWNVFYMEVYLLVLLFVLLVVTHFCLPKRLIDVYYTPPHFSEWEMQNFSDFPNTFVRTVLFIHLIAWRKSRHKRGMDDVLNDTSVWFQWLCKIIDSLFFVFIIPVVVFPFVFIGLIVCLFI